MQGTVKLRLQQHPKFTLTVSLNGQIQNGLQAETRETFINRLLIYMKFMQGPGKDMRMEILMTMLN